MQEQETHICQFCGQDHPSHHHVMEIVAGRVNVIQDGAPLQTRWELKELFTISLALKIARSYAEEELADAQLGKAFRRMEKRMAQKVSIAHTAQNGGEAEEEYNEDEEGY